jgi:hypothetical protein
VSGIIAPARAANRQDLYRAKELRRLLQAELPNVRALAVAWRNGLAGILATLAGFSLIRGRSDVSQLAHPWEVVVGVLLMVSLVVGVIAAFRLLRASTGRAATTPLPVLLSMSLPFETVEAQRALRALRQGIGLVLCCVALLVFAVALTWYGPATP